SGVGGLLEAHERATSSPARPGRSIDRCEGHGARRGTQGEGLREGRRAPKGARRDRRRSLRRWRSEHLEDISLASAMSKPGGKAAFGGISDAVALRALLDGLESAGLGCTMSVVDGDGGRRVYANEAYAAMRGVDVATAIAADPLGGLPKEDAERIAVMSGA